MSSDPELNRRRSEGLPTRALAGALLLACALAQGACSISLFRLGEPVGPHRADPIGARPVDRRMAWTTDRDAGAVGAAAGLDLRSYDVIVVSPFTLSASDLGGEEDRRLAADALGVIRDQLVAGLRDTGVFARVVDAEPEIPIDSATSGRILLLHGHVSRFASGHRLERLMVGFGEGQSQLQVETRFVEAATGRVVLATADRWLASSGLLGGESRAFVLASAGEVARGLAAFVRRAPAPDLARRASE